MKEPRRRKREPLAAPWVELAVGAAWVIGIAGALQLLHLLVGGSPLGVAILGALVVDLAAGRAGLRWFEADPPPSGRVTARLAAIGVGVALAAAAFVLAVGVATGRARIEAGHPSLALGLGVLRAGGLAIRDELLLRGLVLFFARRARISAGYALVFASLTSPAAIALLPGTTPEALVLSAASGLCFGVLWQTTKSAVSAIAAHATWLFTTGVVFRGGVLDVFWVDGVLTAGPRTSGGAAWLAAATLVGISLLGRRHLLKWST